MLDVGGGESPYKKYFKSAWYVCIDVNPQANITILGDVRNLPFRDNIADTILCTEVLEHIQNTRIALKELHRVLKSGGYLILSTPLLWGVHERGDFYRWTEEGIKLHLTQRNFDIIKVEKAGGIFSSIGQMLAQVPLQVYGPYTNRENRLKYGFLFFMYLILIPVTRFFMLLDALDTKKNFTLGYSILGKKL